MADATEFPAWLGTAVVGAVIAALGYVTKLLVESWSAWRRVRAARLGRLLELASLLHASNEVFWRQRQLVSRLEASLRVSHPGVTPDRTGFERHFSQAYGEFNQEEAELHSVIRGMTEHALRPINEAMSEWLTSDLTYRTARGAQGVRGVLATKLNQLDTHLRLWRAKYESWIPNHPQHALVYLADEEQHGVGFPVGLDDLVDKVLREMDAGTAPRRRPTQTGHEVAEDQ